MKFKQYWGLTIFGSLALVLIITAGLAGYSMSKIQEREDEKLRNKLFMITADDPFAGSLDAKVHIVEFADFSCPFSKAAKPFIEDIIKSYGDKIHFVYRDFPIKSHIYGQKAAEAGECAHEQGKFWEWHDKIFTSQDKLTVGNLKKQALAIDMPDMKKFNQCLDSGKYEQEVQDDYLIGEEAGVIGTPTFFINGEIIHGATTREEFDLMIKKYL